MKIGAILRNQQPDLFHQLKRKPNNRKKKQRAKKKEHLSFNDYKKMMQHDSYSRHHGALSQRSWSNNEKV